MSTSSTNTATGYGCERPLSLDWKIIKFKIFIKRHHASLRILLSGKLLFIGLYCCCVVLPGAYPEQLV